MHAHAAQVSTSQSDVWSYGVVLWEIYSYGRTPYPKMNQKEVVDSVIKGYRMEMPEGCPKVSASHTSADTLAHSLTHSLKDVYDKIIMACWEIDPGKRPTFKVSPAPGTQPRGSHPVETRRHARQDVRRTERVRLQ